MPALGRGGRRSAILTADLLMNNDSESMLAGFLQEFVRQLPDKLLLL